ncbi:EcsC family protein [Gloeocapsopsis crepidinum]|uniref:EcsC family protein n=1 Tax=Gloeocapsopsis crepidinum TaxID=693223 RepID=UPI001D149BBD|nr:EcsC family protein [Gloeocapsopsis crepidinum]
MTDPKQSPASDASDIEVTILPPKTENSTSSPKNTATEDKSDAASLFDFFAKTVGDVTVAVATTAAQTGLSLAQTAQEAGEAATKQTHDLISQATQTAGEAVSFIGDNWLVRRFSRVLNLQWIVGATDNVDVTKATEEVRKLQQEYPHESPSEIAHRIMVEKATYAGGIGLASSILPGAALALLAVDLAATTRLQAEMVYQIAAAYGLDLKEPARKGEVLAIFGLALGGGRLLRTAGLGLLRNIPFAGAMIGSSSNAAIMYSVGYAACRFYEAKLDSNSSIDSEETLADIKEQSDRYAETAIAQEAVMDQVLVHMILASHPEKSWEEILPELKNLNFSESSLASIGNNIKSPQPLETLLNQLNRDFAIPLLAQCYRIAQKDGIITPEAARIMEAIADKFDLDLNSIQATVNQGQS